MASADPESFFRRHGFALSFSHPDEAEIEALYLRDGSLSRTAYRRLRKRGEVWPVFADLVSIEIPGLRLRAYGTGASEAEAAERARRRWRQEQGD